MKKEQRRINMKILKKLFGIAVCLIGILVWYIDFAIFAAIGALSGWVALTLGATGVAVLGAKIIGWIVVLNLMLLLLFLGIVAILQGIVLILED